VSSKTVFRRRLFAVASIPIAGALLVGPVAGSAAAASTHSANADPAALSGYLVGQLHAAHVYGRPDPKSGYPGDIGLTADGILALAAAGGHDVTLDRMVNETEAETDVAADPSDANGQFDGGMVGKLALVAEVVGRDPHHFGGSDLIAALGQHVCTNASETCAAPGAYEGEPTSTFSQSLGVLAQARAGGASPAAVAALMALQCPTDGHFPTLFLASPSADPCATGGDVDSTALAAQALSLQSDATSRAATGKALAWIAGQQAPDGGFPGAAGDNTNSTALAVQALNLHSNAYASQIANGQAFLAARQNPDGGLGITADYANSNRRASTQGLSGVIGTPYSTLTHLLYVLPTPPAKAATAVSGAGYLASSHVLTGGDRVESSYTSGGKKVSFVDYGLTADLAIALASTGSQDATLAKLVGYLRAHVVDYADPAGKKGGPFGGSLAKLALVAEITGQNPHDFGGVNLLGQLAKDVCAKPTPDAGQYPPCTAKGDFANAGSPVSQALGVLALQRSARGADHLSAASAPVQRLLQLQCPDGGFSSELTPKTCTGDVDTTGFALQALSLVPDDPSGFASPVADALSRGQDFVLAQQQQGGGFPGAAGINTNSTALAIQALSAAPADAPAPAAGSASPLAAHQSASVRGPALRDALSYLAARQNADGGFAIDADAASSDARASAQAVPSLELAQLSTLRHQVAPVTPPSAPPGGGNGPGTTTGTGPGAGTQPGSGTNPGTSGTGPQNGTRPRLVNNPTPRTRLGGAGAKTRAGGNSAGSRNTKAASGGAALPFTGFGAARLLGLASALILAGAGAMWLGRRKALR
jgi:prenyltransferase beta subunit